MRAKRSGLDRLFAELATATPRHPLNWRVNPRRAAAIEALLEHPGAGERAIAMLTPTRLRFGRTVGAGGVHPDDYDRRDVVRALLHIAAHHHHPKTWELLADLYRTHVIEELRYQAAKLLCTMATNERLGAVRVADPDTFKARLAGVVPWTELRPIVDALLATG